MKNFGLVILGAGASSRMGRPKLLLPWHDTTVVGHLISQWQQLGAVQIAIVHRADDKALVEAIKREELNRRAAVTLQRLNASTHFIPNPQPERGMFSSIVCAANWRGWDDQISHFAIALGDQPHLRLETLSALLKFTAQHPTEICQPAYNGHAHHPVILPRDVFDALSRSSAESLKEFLKPFSNRGVQCVINDAGLALDLDTPEDYKLIHAIK